MPRAKRQVSKMAIVSRQHRAGQPESQFVFRMKEDKYDGVQCALFEADGGAWRLVAMENIKEYLERELEGLEQFTVIA